MADNNITKQLYLNIYRTLGGDPNATFETADDVWNAVTQIYDEGYDPIEISPLDLELTENGTYTYEQTETVDAYLPVRINVNVPTSGGGGGGSSEGGFDWSVLRYTPEDEAEINGIFNTKINDSTIIPEVVTGMEWLDKSKLVYSPRFTFSEGNTSFNVLSEAPLLEYIPLIDTSQITDMGNAFSSCKSLASVPHFDTSNVELMWGMFSNCKNLKNAPDFNTSNVTNMDNMFEHCESLEKAPNFDTSKVESMGSMFLNCKKLHDMPEYDMSNVCSTSSMFEGCDYLGSLEFITAQEGYIPDELTTSDKLISTARMFYGCASISKAPLFHVRCVQDASYMFYNCSSLTTVPVYQFEMLFTAECMFDDCVGLQSLPALNFTNICHQFSMNCYNWEWGSGFDNLTDVGGFTGFGVQEDANLLDLCQLTQINEQSVINIINGLANRTNSISSGTLRLNSNAEQYLTEELRASASSNNWIIEIVATNNP